jgi:hypothetical protein
VVDDFIGSGPTPFRGSDFFESRRHRLGALGLLRGEVIGLREVAIEIIKFVSRRTRFPASYDQNEITLPQRQRILTVLQHKFRPAFCA